MTSADLENFRHWYAMGYAYGRMDAAEAKPYDSRPPSERDPIPSAPAAQPSSSSVSEAEPSP